MKNIILLLILIPVSLCGQTYSSRPEDPAARDAFARLRVSNPQTVFDDKQIYDDPDLASSVENSPLFYDNQETAGTGTATAFNINKASTTLSVTLNTAGTRVRQSRMRFNYQPGKSQLVLLTFVMGSANQAGITRREGLFDQDNGLFFEDNGTNYGFVRRTNVTGTAVDNRITQANWNVDKMDGTGESGITLDFTKTQILVIDYEWLGVGRVRLGFNVDGVTYIAHEFLNANNLSEVYMSSPNLPLRSEISNNGSGPAASMDKICSSVVSEGGQEQTGLIRTVSTAGTHVDATTEDTWYAVIGIRLKSGYLGQTVNVLQLAIQEQAEAKKLEWGLFFNPTVAGTFTYTGVAQSGIEAATGATANTVTGGYQLTGGFFESGDKSAGSTLTGISNALRLGSLINGTPDQIVLCVKTVGGTSAADVEAALTYLELK